MITKYIIEDWAGNRIAPNETFKTFDDAWEYIAINLAPNDDDMQEYSVEGVES